MTPKSLFLVALICLPFWTKAQIHKIVHEDRTTVNLVDQDKMVVSKFENFTLQNDISDYRVVSVPANEHIKILDCEIQFFVNGVKQKPVKQKDFSVYSPPFENGEITDERYLYFSDFPTAQKVRVEFSYSYISKNTAFIPGWSPLKSEHVLVQASTYELKNETDFMVFSRAQNMPSTDYSIEESENGSLQCKLLKPTAQKKEPLKSQNSISKLSIQGEKFALHGKMGSCKTWRDFGDFVASLMPAPSLSAQTILSQFPDLSTLSDYEKVDTIYDWMKNRSRYVSIQLGIGGWEPTPAATTHSRQYGDCKALAVYTKELLKSAGIPSYYTIGTAGRAVVDFNEKFPQFDGNHAFLCVPLAQDTIWLECTSANSPTGHIAGFTDDRMVLVLFDDGARLVKTKGYDLAENRLTNNLTLDLAISGPSSIQVTRTGGGTFFQGIQYFATLTPKERREYLVNRWNFVGSAKEIETKTKTSDLASQLSFSLQTDKLLRKVGPYYTLKIFDLISHSTPTYDSDEDRKNPFEIQRNTQLEDSLVINIPAGYIIADLPPALDLEASWGSYHFSSELNSENQLILHFLHNKTKGVFAAEEWEEFVAFRKKIMKQENKTILLKPDEN